MESSFSGTQSFPEAFSPDRGTQPIKHHRWANICLWELPGEAGLCSAGAGGAAECPGASRASASVWSRRPSIFLGADIKGNRDAHCLPLWVMPVLQEAFTDTIRAAGTAQPVEQLWQEEPLKTRLYLSVFMKLMTNLLQKDLVANFQPFSPFP